MIKLTNSKELAWASGLFQGEGSISGPIYYDKRPGRNPRPRLEIRIAMTDQESIDRFFLAIGKIGYTRGPYISHHGKKPFYIWQAHKFQEFQAAVAMLWYGLSEVRKRQARKVSNRYLEYMRYKTGSSTEGRAEKKIIGPVAQVVIGGFVHLKDDSADGSTGFESQAAANKLRRGMKHGVRP